MKKVLIVFTLMLTLGMSVQAASQKHRHTRARLSILRLSDAGARKTSHRDFPLPGSFRHALSGCAAARQKGIHQEKQPSSHVCLPSCSLAGPSHFRHNPALNLSVPVITSSVHPDRHKSSRSKQTRHQRAACCGFSQYSAVC